MEYRIISADCHIDLPWMPPDLFVANAAAEFRGRMPRVVDGPKGPKWVSGNGGEFGLVNGMGSAGREYVPGQIHRSDRMAATGLYDDGRRGIRRLTEPHLRLQDQDRDGVQAEVLYGILGAAGRLGDDAAAAEMMRIYNEWLAGFCATHPDRLVGLACIPNHDMGAALAEIERVRRRGGIRGIEVANTLDLKPLYHPDWEPLWAAAEDAQLTVHFHTIGGKPPDFSTSRRCSAARHSRYSSPASSWRWRRSSWASSTAACWRRTRA